MGNAIGIIEGASPLVGGYSTGKKNSSSGSKDRKFSIPDSIPDETGKLNTDIDAMPFRTTNYFALKNQAEQYESIMNISFYNKFMNQYMGDEAAFMAGESRNLAESTLKTIEMKNMALAYHEKAEYEKQQYANSDLAAMGDTEVLANPNGDYLKTSDLLNGEVLKNALATNPEFVIRKFGLDPQKVIEETGGDLNKTTDYLIANEVPIPMRKIDRVMLQQVLPLGTGWDDVKKIDMSAYESLLQETAKNIGNAEVGTDGQLYLQSLSKDDVNDAVTHIFGTIAPNDPETNRVINYRLNGLKTQALFQIAGSSDETKKLYDRQFEVMSDIRDYFNIDGFNTFAYQNNNDKLAGMIEQDKNLTPEQKKLWGTVLSAQNGKIRNNTLLYRDAMDRGVLDPAAEKDMFRSQLMEEDANYIISLMDVDDKPYDYSAWMKIREAQTGDFRSWEQVEPYKEAFHGDAVKLSAEVLSDNSKAVVLYDDNRTDRISKWITTTDKKVIPEELKKKGRLWMVGHLSSYNLYQTNGDVFNDYVKYLKSNPTAAPDGKFSGELMTSIIKDGHDYDNMNGDPVGDIGPGGIEYVSGIHVDKTLGGSYIPWAAVMATDEFKEWAEKNLSSDQKNKLWGMDAYMSNLVKPAHGVTSFDKALQKSGVKDVERFKIQNEANKYSPNVGSYNHKGDGEYYDPSTKTAKRMPTDYIIVEESAALPGLKLVGQSGKGTKEGFVETYIAISKEDLEQYGWIDMEGGKRLYSEAFGDIDKLSLYELMGRDPKVKKYLETVGMGAINLKTKLDKGDVEDLYKEMYVIPFFMKRDLEKYFQGMANQHGMTNWEKKTQRDKLNEGTANTGVTFNY